MKVLLTGGTGFVGTAVREELKNLGHDVRLLVRRGSRSAPGPGEGFEILHGDILDTHACMRAVDGISAVINLVGILREIPEEGTTYEALHTEATFGIVDAARRQGVSRVIQMSGLGARPDAPSRYHTTKYEAEEIVKKSGMRWTIFRPSVIFGPGDDFHPQMIDLVQRPVVPIIDGGKSQMQPVALENVVGPIARALTMPETQGKVYEVGGPDRITFGELIERVARHCEVWMNTVKVSSRVMKPTVKMLQRFRSFPLTTDQLMMLLEDNICDTDHFTEAFDVELDSYVEAMPGLLARLTDKAA